MNTEESQNKFYVISQENKDQSDAQWSDRGKVWNCSRPPGKILDRNTKDGKINWCCLVYSVTLHIRCTPHNLVSRMQNKSKVQCVTFWIYIEINPKYTTHNTIHTYMGYFPFIKTVEAVNQKEFFQCCFNLFTVSEQVGMCHISLSQYSGHLLRNSKVSNWYVKIMFVFHTYCMNLRVWNISKFSVIIVTRANKYWLARGSRWNL